MTRVLVADDHPVFRAGLKTLFAAEPDMDVVAEVANGDEAYQLAADLEPDVLVIDLSMPGLNGAQATCRVRREHPGVNVMVLTVHEEREYLAQLLSTGACGYVLKRAAPQEIVRAVRAVASGGTYIDASVAGALAEDYLKKRQRRRSTASGALVSDRERQVLARVARGFSNKQIAAQLELSIKTVETYKARVVQKLGLQTRVDIVRYAMGEGWLSEPLDPT